MDVTRLIFKIYTMYRLFKTMLCLYRHFIIVSHLSMTMTVLIMVYGAVTIANDCANLKKTHPRYFLLQLLHCCYFVARLTASKKIGKKNIHKNI